MVSTNKLHRQEEMLEILLWRYGRVFERAKEVSGERLSWISAVHAGSGCRCVVMDGLMS